MPGDYVWILDFQKRRARSVVSSPIPAGVPVGSEYTALRWFQYLQRRTRNPGYPEYAIKTAPPVLSTTPVRSAYPRVLALIPISVYGCPFVCVQSVSTLFYYYPASVEELGAALERASGF